MNQKKIVFVLPQLKTGGGVRVIVELANILCTKYPISFVFPNSQNDCTFNIDTKIEIEKIGELPEKSVDKIKNIFKMFFYLRKNHRDSIIITTDPVLSPLFLFFPFQKLYRYVQADDYRIFDDLLLLKNRFFLSIYKLITKLSYKQDIGYLFNSRYTYQKFVELKGKTVPEMIVHPSVNHKRFYPFREQKTDDKINISLIARRHPMKRFEDFITVYKQIKKMPDILAKIDKIFIISHDDLSQFDTKDFTMVIPEDDSRIAQTLNQSDIFIFTSLWEGFGLPPLEAMSCGCAVITSDAKGINEYAVEGYNALIYPPTDTKILKNKLTELIENKTLRHTLQQNAIKSAQEFSWEKSAQALISYLNEGNMRE